MPQLNQKIPARKPGDDFLSAITEENKSLSTAHETKAWQELKNFAGFTKTMIWAFPVARIMRWKIRRNKRLKQILQFKELLPVRNNIEKGSFAYDTLLFRENIFSLLRNKSHLANLVCLAILFGDEFIDGIAIQFGKKQTAALLQNPGYNFNLQYKKNEKQKHELFYAFDICELLPCEVLQSMNAKYEISYGEFYNHLLYLLAEMNRQLAALPAGIAEEAAQLICTVCNLCFYTYQEDVSGFDDGYDLDELMAYQKSKDEDIVNILLSLRAVLLGKKTLEYQKNFSSWSSMIRCMQLYDDMEDAAHDCDFQMNMCCWVAKNYFDNEWQWLLKNRDRLKTQKGILLNATIALNMPGSCMMVQQYASNISMSKMNWVQQKIINYLWCKNWLGFKNKVLNDRHFSFETFMPHQSTSLKMQLNFIQQQVSKVRHPFITEEMKNAWMIDTAMMDTRLRKHICSRLNFRERYSLVNHILQWDICKKSMLVKKILE